MPISFLACLASLRGPRREAKIKRVPIFEGSLLGKARPKKCIAMAGATRSAAAAASCSKGLLLRETQPAAAVGRLASEKLTKNPSPHNTVTCQYKRPSPRGADKCARDQYWAHQSISWIPYLKMHFFFQTHLLLPFFPWNQTAKIESFFFFSLLLEGWSSSLGFASQKNDFLKCVLFEDLLWLFFCLQLLSVRNCNSMLEAKSATVFNWNACFFVFQLLLRCSNTICNSLFWWNFCTFKSGR